MKTFQNTRNPILPLDIHVPDSEAHVFSDGKLYIYGSYDNQPDRFCSDRYVVISTKDLKEWHISDVSFRGSQVPWVHDPNAVKYNGVDWNNSPFLKRTFMKNMIIQALSGLKSKKKAVDAPKADPRELLFAPDCMERDGKYYLYFCMADNSEGVAVSDSPEGPFTDPIQIPVGGIDPAVFVDEDGSAYYYWGQIFAHGVKLNADRITFDADKIKDKLVTEQQHFFHEGSSMRRIGDTYYYVYADMERGKPTALGYATSKSPLGPFDYRGIIVDNAFCDPNSWNNHGSIECINGQWYVFYHRCSRNSQLHRRLCIEPIEIRLDGTIPEVKMTSQGPGKPFAKGDVIMGYQACELHGKSYIDVDSKYGEKLTNLRKGDEIFFRYVQSSGAFTAIDILAKGSGSIQVYFGNTLAGEIEIISGRQIQNRISMDPGTHELRLHIKSSKKLELFSVKLG